MKNVEILNKIWKSEDLILIASTKVIKELIAEYKADANCRACDWIAGEKISHIEKASFIYSCLF
jgi:hypothetical protein